MLCTWGNDHCSWGFESTCSTKTHTTVQRPRKGQNEIMAEQSVEGIR